MKLPSKPRDAAAVNPRLLLISAQTKTGKTTAITGLKNNLVLDLEDGSEHVDNFLGINIIREADAYNLKNPNEPPLTPLDYLGQVIMTIRSANKEAGKKVYDYVTIDTSTGLIDLALALATRKYKQSVQGGEYKGDNILSDIGHGGGYVLLGNAFESLLTSIRSLAEKATIITVHPKTSSIKKEGKDLEVQDIHMPGKTKLFLCKEACAIGWMFRKGKNQNILSFQQNEESIVVGCRPKHLRDKEFVISELQEDGTFKFNWDQIFINE